MSDMQIPMMIGIDNSRIDQAYKDNGVLGAKNLYSKEVTKNSSNNSYLTSNSFYLKAGNYIITFTNVSSSDMLWWFSNTSPVSDLSDHTLSPNDKVNLAFTVLSDGYCNLGFRYNPASSSILPSDVSNLMIRLATDPDDTYQPYAMTNQELTEIKTYDDSILTLSTGVTIVGTFSIQKNNHLIIISGTLQTQLTDHTWNLLCTFPVGYRPTSKIRGCMMDDTHVESLIFEFNKNGTLYVWGTPTSSSSKGNIDVYLCYFTA